jgi:prepilin-type N-terminal cleavage/methylation domain-containing protein
MCLKATIRKVWARSEEIVIRVRDGKTKVGRVESRGFTLVELLVVISITSVLMGIIVPVLGKVRRQARAVQGMNNQKEIASALNLFASDNDERYPRSVAVVANEDTWNWSDPTRFTTLRVPAWSPHRAMSEYLRSYIADASTMYCPSAPRKQRYLQQPWDAGDGWDNPDNPWDRPAAAEDSANCS